MSREDHTLERDRELERIAVALDSATRGEGRIVVIEGTAGIGKTRLVGTCRAMAKQRGFGRLQAIGDALESAMPWGVVRQMVERSVTRYQGEVREAILAGPSGAALAALDGAAADPSEAELARTLHALWWVAVDLSATRPLLITVDDTHWSDLPSLQFLVYLSRRISDLPIALVVATRPPAENSGPLAQLSDSRHAERMLPRPLTREALSELAASRGVRPAADVVTALYDASGGNPFLATVLLDELETLELPLDHAATAVRIGGLGPSTVFRAALGRLPADAVRLAGAAAVLGPGGDPWLTGAVADVGVADLPPAVEALVAAHVLADDAEHLRFLHPVVREAVLADLGPMSRAALHARAATELSAGRAPADRIAAHLMHAPRGTLPDAVDVLRHAAAALLAAGDGATAATHLERAVSECPDDAGLRAEWGRALLRTGNAREARNQLRAAAAGLPDAELVAAAASATAIVDGPQVAIEELTQAIAARPAGAREAGRMHLEARLAVIRSFLPEQRKVASAHLRGYATLPGITPDERTLLGLLAQMGRYEVWPAEEVAATARRALAGGAYFDDATGSIDAMVAWLVALVALIAADGFDDARREIDRAKQRVRLHGSPVEFAMVCNPAIIMHWQLGNLAFVEAEAEGVLAAVSEEDPVAQVIALRATATHFGAYCALERGDVDGAATLLARFDAEHSDVPRMLPTIWLHEPRASVALARGNPELARAEAFEQRDQLHAIGVDPPTMSWRSPAVQALLLLGEQREARTLAGELVAVARKWNTPTDVGPALRVLAHAEPDGRLALLTEAVAVLETSRARLHLARALVDLGEALRVAGRRSEARDPLHRGIDLATECGSIALRTRAVAALESLGDRPRKLMFAGVQALTASERRVADLALTGRANREIAHELFVTPKTVENHLGRIYTKLGINGRRELARALS
ncbi:DNA-binding CsgD family transcriptional regulator/Flp pilus assembly protein TadD [Actinophytocola algeriensis]|uniref:DNA-binding CsgD family transcriptional regulator/Flp pilus assembly protein TadD n=3 Tax=Actinophytocola algeriensis TaxID=1768010 RepID=A0A7W7QEX3_9PSEU|nr:LuxR family transcriptional regulator [Actinophytocola algeriensis]MBB4912258.1 DNA-binding CsgD family transcriptional regulator/Flp pilus assembly protein TadD [Actinophytocola algeriensis]MBE1474226.1 DNA-binding CsgD family transcriptional regulator/Flp pilus assembly protein TadD [Actinophytocola algeriensis]